MGAVKIVVASSPSFTALSKLSSPNLTEVFNQKNPIDVCKSKQDLFFQIVYKLSYSCHYLSPCLVKRMKINVCILCLFIIAPNLKVLLGWLIL